MSDTIRVFMLLKFCFDTNKPFYMVIEDDLYKHDPTDTWEDMVDNKTFWVEEHTCPTNIIRIEQFIYDGDEDPHGILEVVDIVKKPDDYDDIIDVSQGNFYMQQQKYTWKDLFPILNKNLTIDGKIEYSMLSKTKFIGK